jgi:predicted phosphate transport protein (TIGR00153 family)
MFARILPRETGFFDFFDSHAALTVAGTREFQSLVSTGANIISKAKRIKEIEHEADVVTHQCVEALHRTFITPFDRNDIHRLISRMDDVLDLVESASDRISLYEVETMWQGSKDLADVLVRSAEALEQAVNGLRDLRHADAIRERCIEVNRLENEADAILRNTIAALFRKEKDPIQVIKWKEIYEILEAASDRCEDVANVIEGVILEQA